jgi:predicted nucleic acid-binding protein
MNVVDSSAWLEYLADSPNADRFAEAIEDVEDLIVPAITVYEVFKRVAQQLGEQPATEAASAMLQAAVVPLDAGIAVAAARLSLALRLPMADSMILATARQYGATLWTQDAQFEGLPDVRYYAR